MSKKTGADLELVPHVLVQQVYVNVKSLLIAGRLQLPDNGELRGGFVNTLAFYGRNNTLSIQHERTADGRGSGGRRRYGGLARLGEETRWTNHAD